MYPTEHFAAVAAENHLGEAMVATPGSVLPIRAGVDYAATDKFFLHLHENFTRDNGLMGVPFIW
jgi:hypothetical protein